MLSALGQRRSLFLVDRRRRLKLNTLVASFPDDLNANITLTVEGTPRTLTPHAGLALYRGAQEAFTNVVRYAPGAVTSVVLRDDRSLSTLSRALTT